MGLFDFGPKRPYHRVSVREYRERVLPYLRNVEFSDQDLSIIEGLILGNLEEGDRVREGIDEKEFGEILSWLRSHTSRHSLSESQIAKFESIMKKYLEKST